MVNPGPLTYTHTVITQDGNSVAVVAANDRRQHLLIQNIGANKANLKIGAAAVVDEGIHLNAADASGNVQGEWESSARLGNLTQMAINTIGTNGQKLLVTEGQ